MRKILTARLTIQVVKWLLLSTVALYVLTGFGVTRFAVFQPIAVGALVRGWSYAIHTNLIAPLVILLALHIFLYFYCRTCPDTKQ
jgi:hypothetical protein